MACNSTEHYTRECSLLDTKTRALFEQARREKLARRAAAAARAERQGSAAAVVGSTPDTGEDASALAPDEGGETPESEGPLSENE